MSTKETSQHTVGVSHALFKLTFQVIKDFIGFIFRFLRILGTARNFAGKLINGLINLIFCELARLIEWSLVVRLALIGLITRLTLRIISIIRGKAA